MSSEPHTPVPVGDHPMWNESQYVWWYDANAGISGAHRIAHLPNDAGGRAQIWHALLTHDGRRYRRGAEVALDPAWRAGDAYRTEALELRYRATGVHVQYDSPDASVDLQFTDLHEPVSNSDLTDHEKGTASPGSPNTGPGHVEVGGRVRGVVRMAGQEIPVDGLGYRDHTWGGFRDFSHIRSSRWANGTVGAELTFGIAYSARGNGVTITTGFVARDGVARLVTDFDIVCGVEADSICWRDAQILMVCDDGSELEVEIGPTFDGQIFESRELLVFDAPSSARLDGIAGVGNIGMATNARGGHEYPPLILSACHEDGFARRPARTGPRIRYRR
jgi:hypothetical protein